MSYDCSHEFNFSGVYAHITTGYFDNVEAEVDFREALPAMVTALQGYAQMVEQFRDSDMPVDDVYHCAYSYWSQSDMVDEVIAHCHPLVKEYYGHGWCDDVLHWITEVVVHYELEVPSEVSLALMEYTGD